MADLQAQLARRRVRSGETDTHLQRIIIQDELNRIYSKMELTPLQRRVRIEPLLTCSDEQVGTSALQAWITAGPLLEPSPYEGFVRTTLLHRGKDDKTRVTYVIDWEKEREMLINCDQDELVQRIQRFQDEGKPFVYPDVSEKFSLAYTALLEQEYQVEKFSFAYTALLEQDYQVPRADQRIVSNLLDVTRTLFISDDLSLSLVDWDTSVMTYCRGREDEHQENIGYATFGTIFIPGPLCWGNERETIQQRNETTRVLVKADRIEDILGVNQTLRETHNETGYTLSLPELILLGSGENSPTPHVAPVRIEPVVYSTGGVNNEEIGGIAITAQPDTTRQLNPHFQYHDSIRRVVVQRGRDLV